MNTRYQPRERRFLHGAVILFVLVTCIRVWTGPAAIVKPAQAQIPDSGMQRKLLLEETRRTNQLLTEIKQLLKTHTFNVRAQSADKKASTPGVPHGGR